MTPQTAAGCLTEPPVSVPIEPQAILAATTAPEPIEEPPGSYSGFHGFLIGGMCALKPVGLIANSSE